MFLPGGPAAERERKDRQSVETALESARRIVESDAPASLKAIDECLKVLDHVNQINFPLDRDLLEKLRSKREKAREQELDGRSDSEKSLDASELARIKKEIEEIEKQIKKIEEERAKTLLGKILAEVYSFTGFEPSTELADLIRQSHILHKRKQEIQKR